MTELSFTHAEAVRNAGRGLVEGPCVLGEEVVFSDAIGGGVFALAADGAVRTVLERRRGIGGIAVARDGGLVVSGRDVSVWDGGLRTLWSDPACAGVNDLCATADGSVVAGVLRYRVLAGEEPVPGELIRIAPDGTAAVVAEDILWANGVVEAPDGALLVSDYARGHVKRVAPDGEVAVFVALDEGQPDGVALDAEGALWVATGPAGGLQRFRADGAPAGSLLSAPAPVPGAPVPLAAA